MSFLFLGAISLLFTASKGATCQDGSTNCVCTGGELKTTQPTRDAYVAGDPHFIMFNHARHDFQGQTTGFYYYMTPIESKGFTNSLTSMPFNLIAKHDTYWKTLKIISYAIVEVFDTQNIYYVYVKQTKVGYYSVPIAQQNVVTLAEAEKKGNWKALSPSSTAEQLGSNTKITYTTSGNYKNIVLEVTGCTGKALEIRLQGHYFRTGHASGYWSRIFGKTDCYKCKTTCFFGDYYHKGKAITNPVNGNTVGLATGHYSYNTLAYNDLLSQCRDRKTAVTPAPTIVGLPDRCENQAFLDKVLKACVDEYNAHTTQQSCCQGTSSHDCADERVACWADVCAVSNQEDTEPDVARLRVLANAILTESLKDVCTTSGTPPPGPPRKYAFINQAMTFCAARTYCQNHADYIDLAVITTSVENTAAKTACGNNRCWIGYNREKPDKGKVDLIFNWVEPEGDAAGFTDWQEGEPSWNQDGGNEKERCAQIDGTYENAGKWNDIGCGCGGRGRTDKFLCTKKATTSGTGTAPGAKINIVKKVVNNNNNNDIELSYGTFAVMIFVIGCLLGVVMVKFVSFIVNKFFKNTRTKKINYKPVIASSEEETSDMDKDVL